MPSFFADRIRLPLVLCHSRMDGSVGMSDSIDKLSGPSVHPSLLDDIRTDGRLENGRQRVSGSAGSTICRSNSDSWTSSHLCSNFSGGESRVNILEEYEDGNIHVCARSCRAS